MKTSILIQARLGSSRLPGKVLMDIAGQPMVWHVIQRCKAVEENIHVAVVTTTEKKDDVLADYLKSIHVDTFRGSEQDVLDRYYQAAQLFQSDVIVRITSDCPLLDPQVTRKVISACSGAVDFASNVIDRTYPRGLDTEVMKKSTLDRIWKMARESSHREHVTKYIYDHKAEFNVVSCRHSEDLSSMRWTVDEPTDFEFVTQVYAHLYSKEKIFGLDEVVQLMRSNPTLADVNASVKQKI